MNGGSTQVRIVTFRVKIASLKNVTTLHGELLADQVGSRLKTGHHGPEGEQCNPHGVNSSIVLGMIKNNSLKSFRGEYVDQEGGLLKVSGGAVLGQKNVDPSHLGKLSR